ncbi:unnamed protein product [marine sediment metagenome]|uniref:Uncharacterized protein n=1 Tax=marine sediment metagenome TaxID=412755 RepID=X1CCU4_9ZZZZ
MAKRKAARRYAPRAKRTYRKARGTGKGGIINNVVDGLIVGTVQNFVPNDALFGFGDALVPLGVGWFRKNPTLQVIGGYQLGLKIAGKMTGVTGGSGFATQ